MNDGVVIDLVLLEAGQLALERKRGEGQIDEVIRFVILSHAVGTKNCRFEGKYTFDGKYMPKEALG